MFHLHTFKKKTHINSHFENQPNKTLDSMNFVPFGREGVRNFFWGADITKDF